MTADFERLFHDAPFGYATLDAAGNVSEINDTLLGWLGRTRDAVVGSAFSSLLVAGSRLFWETRHQQVLLLRGEANEVALSLVREDGEQFSVLVNSTAVTDEAGAPVGARVAVIGSTERHQYERSLLDATRAAEAMGLRLQALQSSAAALIGATRESEVAETIAASATAAFDASGASVFLVDTRGELLSAGGVQRATNPGGPVVSVFADGRPIVIENLAQAEERYPQFLELMRTDRIEAFSAVPLVTVGAPLGVLLCTFARARTIDAAMVDLQQALALQATQAIVRVRLQARLEHLALHDPLTGLANRQLLHDRLDHSLVEHSDAPLAVVFFDLDGFKQVNDVEGHAVGDAVLAEVGDRLTHAVRADDFCARFGGDEFVVLCAAADADAAAAVAERIRLAIAEPFAATRLPITASIGVAVVAAASSTSADVLLETADSAMYRAKDAGRNRVAVETI